MKLLLASSEVHPYSKTGGLADMVGALARTLARLGHRVGVVTPLYLGIREQFPNLQRTDLPLDVPLGVERVSGDVCTLEPSENLTIYFVDQPAFYQRTGLYQIGGIDYPDNAQRFIFFSKAVAHLALHLPWKPEIAHLNDWQSALAALFLRHQRKLPGWESGPQICLTIHNLAYQGLFPASQYALTNLPWDYFQPEGVEFFGNLNCLKAGIAYADLITTVSPRYAREITTSELGCGLDGLLRGRHSRLFGILNGVDYEEWNTTHNPFIEFSFSAADLGNKTANKLALQRDLGLPAEPGIPLFANIGRLAEQKGVDVLLGALEEMLYAEMQFVLLGTGSPVFQRAFEDLARRFPQRAAVTVGFDGALSHQIEAAGDFFLMPSRFEPCGLNQMYSLRYGTIPVVHATGGLDDTVVDIREDPAKADGIKFHEHSGRALAKAMRKALTLFHQPDLLRHYQQNGMAADFSWERTARRYVELYNRAT